MGWNYLGIICAVCAVLCAVGFYKFVYFLSVGYGFAIAGGSIAVSVIALSQGWAAGREWLLILQTVLFIAYGARLSGFLLVRELKNASYRKTLKEATGNDKKMPFFVLLTIWISVTVLYTAQLSPVFFRYFNAGEGMAEGGIVLPLVGIAVSVFGIALESLADRQKSAQKKERPDMVATKGLYRFMRCPNYMGEITFWTGIFVAGIDIYHGIGQWLMAALAYICIVYIMINGAQRLDRRQEKRYGNDPEYRAYADHTPIILPLLPVSHIGKYKD